MERYRALGADPPGTDPARDHGARFEGYYWRFCDPRRGETVVVLCGLSRLGARRWAVVALAAHPAGCVSSTIVEPAAADRRRFAVAAGEVLRADRDSLRVRIGSAAALDAEWARARPWPRRWLGASGVAHLVPALPQYWHPWLLGGAAAGEVRVGGRRIPLGGARVYAEKNWGGTFPARWWWGQADDFDADVCVAFAGGPLAGAGAPRRAAAGLAPTLAVVRLGDRMISFAPPASASRAVAGGGAWMVRARSPLHALELEGEEAGSAVILPVPRPDRIAVAGRSRQALAGRMRLDLRRGRRRLLRAESRLAGLEHDHPG